MAFQPLRHQCPFCHRRHVSSFTSFPWITTVTQLPCCVLDARILTHCIAGFYWSEVQADADITFLR